MVFIDPKVTKLKVLIDESGELYGGSFDEVPKDKTVVLFAGFESVDVTLRAVVVSGAAFSCLSGLGRLFLVPTKDLLEIVPAPLQGIIVNRC